MKTTKLSFWINLKCQLGSNMKRFVLIQGYLTPGFLFPINLGDF